MNFCSCFQSLYLFIRCAVQHSTEVTGDASLKPPALSDCFCWQKESLQRRSCSSNSSSHAFFLQYKYYDTFTTLLFLTTEFTFLHSFSFTRSERNKSVIDFESFCRQTKSLSHRIKSFTSCSLSALHLLFSFTFRSVFQMSLSLFLEPAIRMQ